MNGSPRNVSFTIPRELYDYLESKLESPIVNQGSTDSQVAYIVGIQRVLKLLREMVV